MGKFADYAKNYKPLEQNNPFGENVTTDYNVSVETPEGWFNDAQAINQEVTLIDGDTFTDRQGNKYRLAGAAAPETTKVTEGPAGWFDDVGRTVEIETGQPFGQETMQAVNAVINAGGFNRMVKTGDTSYDREVVRFTNDKGEDLTEALYRSGILRPDKNTEQAFVDIHNAGEIARKLGIGTGYTDIATKLDEVIHDQRILGGKSIVQFGGEALTEQDLVTGNESYGYHNLYTDVAFRNPDRDINNVAHNSIGESAQLGWLGMKEGAFGAAELLGDSLGIDWVKEAGTLGIEKTGKDKAEIAEISNLDFNEVNGIGDFMQFVGNNTAMSVPYLGLIAGGSLLSPVVGGGLLGAAVSTLPAAAVYSGQIWNEMEGDKNAGAALMGGVLAASVDKLGLNLIMGKVFPPRQLLSAAGRTVAAQALVDAGKATSLEAAEQMILKITQKEAFDLMKHSAATAAQQSASLFNRTNIVRNAAQAAVVGGVGEATTEAMQETIQYVTASELLGSDKQFNQWELEDRIQNAMLAAFGPGSGFAVAGSVVQSGGMEAQKAELERANIQRLNEVDQIRERMRVNGEPILSVEEILEGVREKRGAWDVQQEALLEQEQSKRAEGKKRVKRESRIGSFGRRARRHQRDERGFYNTLKNLESFPDAVAKAATGLGKLWNAASVTAFKPEELANREYGHILQNIRALVGQGRGVINSGRAFEAKQDLVYGSLAQMVYIPQVLNRFKATNVLGEASRKEITTLLREFGRDGWYEQMKAGNEVDLPAHLAEHKDALYQTAMELEKQAAAIRDVQVKALAADGDHEGFGELAGWWWKHQDLDPAKVIKNKDAFYEFVRNNTGMDDKEIDEFYDRISGGDATSLTDYFSHVAGVEFTPEHQKAREANLSEKEGFEMFANENMFTTMDNAALSASRFSVNREYFGNGGRNLDIMFDELEKAGMDPAKVDEVAWYTKSIIDSSTGNFNRIQSPRWAAVNKMAATWSIFAGLPLSTLSSIPESAMITLGLTGPEASKAISKMGMEVASTFAKSADRVFKEAVAAGNLTAVPDGANYAVSKDQERLDKAGLWWSPASAGKRVGVGEVNINYRWLQDRFFAGIGLTNITQAQRRASGAVATDFVTQRLSELAQAGDMKNLTNRQQHIYNQLAELGINVDQMLGLWNEYGTNELELDYAKGDRDIPADVMSIIDDNMQTAVYNFVNMRIQNPGAANRPLFFQDPHWQLITQFNGFISTFSANVVPKLWNDYIKRGAPQVKYNTFATMAAMMMLGGASQYLKDWLKYGRMTPYLEGPQQFQRAIYSSGVLGQAERVVEAVIPIYGGAHHGTLAAQLWGIAVGEAGPTARIAGTLGTAAQQAIGGEGERAAQTLAKTAPLIAPVTGLRKGLVGSLFGGSIGDQYREYDEL